jgi:hypothetical protein
MRAFSLRFCQLGLILDKYNPSSALSLLHLPALQQIIPEQAFSSFLLNCLFLCASPSTCPAKDTGGNIRAGQFPDMLGIEEGSKIRKEREEAIHPPDHKIS